MSALAEYSEAEKAQAKMRLVRLDAEGNPVDGSSKVFRITHFYATAPDTLEDSMRKIFEVKRMEQQFDLTGVDPETIKLLKGEE